MLHCATHNVEKPDQAYTNPLEVGFTSKHRCTAATTFFQGQYEQSYKNMMALGRVLIF